MTAMKCTMHLGKKWSKRHNLRQYDKEKWNKDGHIDEYRSELNKVLTDTPLEEVIYTDFSDALVAYNDKNYKKHPDRLIGFKSAKEYEKAKPEERRTRAVKAYYNEQKKNVQEAIIQLGDHEGYMQLVKQYGKQKADGIYTEYLTETYNKFVGDNPSLKVFSAVIHMDETKNGTPHLHIDFLPVAESSRGLTHKVSLEGALNALGFKRKKEQKFDERPYVQWLRDRRTAFEDFAQSFSNKHKLGIVIIRSEQSNVRHEQPEDWKARQRKVDVAQGMISALTGKDKKLKEEAANYIISNAQAVAEGITQEAVKKQKKANDDMAAAQQIAAGAREAIKVANQAREQAVAAKKKIDAERAKLSDEREALSVEREGNIAEVNRQVRRRLSAEKLHRDMSKVSAAQQRRMKQIGVTIDENDVTIPKR